MKTVNCKDDPISQNGLFRLGLCLSLLLLAGCSSPGAKSASFLHDDILRGDYQSFQTKINNGADVNATNRFGFTPLYLCTVKDRTEMAEVLIQKGARVNAVGTAILGDTALQGAVKSRSAGMVKLLAGHGAAIEGKDSEGRTPLLIACAGYETGSVEVVTELLNAGANVLATDTNGFTPLHRSAIISGCEGVTRALLQKGADPDLPDHCGITPLGIALLHNHREKVKLLSRGIPHLPLIQQEKWHPNEMLVVLYDSIPEEINALNQEHLAQVLEKSGNKKEAANAYRSAAAFFDVAAMAYDGKTKAARTQRSKEYAAQVTAGFAREILAAFSGATAISDMRPPSGKRIQLCKDKAADYRSRNASCLERAQKLDKPS